MKYREEVDNLINIELKDSGFKIHVKEGHVPDENKVGQKIFISMDCINKNLEFIYLNFFTSS